MDSMLTAVGIVGATTIEVVGATTAGIGGATTAGIVGATIASGSDASSTGSSSLRLVPSHARALGERQIPRVDDSLFNGDGEHTGVLMMPRLGGLLTTPSSMSPLE